MSVLETLHRNAITHLELLFAAYGRARCCFFFLLLLLPSRLVRRHRVCDSNDFTRAATKRGMREQARIQVSERSCVCLFREDRIKTIQQ